MDARHLLRHRLTGLAAAGLLATALAAPVSAGAGTVAPAAPVTVVPAAPGPYCGISWGSLAKKNAVSHTTGTLEDVRAGQHDCYDRLVLDVDDVPGGLSYDVRYVDVVRTEGSGKGVPLAGPAQLRIVLRAPAYDAQGRATYRPADRAHLVDVAGWSTFRQVAWAGSVEGQTTVGLGVRARLPFRVFVLDGPGDGARLVIDVAHRW
ncbi:AMIN-like domain-containing (lipo)protein [Ornithinimicrobium avium]|uniref:AMIN-like domain-containing protein n=1 Tax=Ornithinimicrobium avium TaxID=2283195 RepID=A0A345NPT8_9MICO|nr:hypothetical protein [Ornithinimicrobium avium]AXH97046.1 hypothetical protein DV701_13765 [Ornithinimicrobium avium]